VGCPECKQTGYRGRIAVHEVLVVTDSMRELINQNGQTAPASKFRPALDEIGFNDAMFDAAMKTAAGLTSVEEFRTHFG
jgi:type II secretory ATPase GspE/PulE/Tfp pilus assembly ATPase PilB-like protein